MIKMNLNLELICTEVVTLAKSTAAFIKREGESFDTGRIEHKSPVDLVSYVDKESEKMLVQGLSLILPDAGFVTEEGTVQQAASGLKWIIDPLDGTTNFLHKVPPYSISIALWDEEELLLGVVHEITHSESFYAWKGGGAWCNGKKIHVSLATAISASLIAVGFPYSLQGKNEQYFSIIKSFTEKSHGLRRLGSAAVDLAYVACGRFEAYFEFNLKIWDIAAGILIVREAGGKVSDFKGRSNALYGSEILATGQIHEEMLSVIGPVWN
jgi:myo-inositol-1(or 4)-monophosphatase